jgi:hypothetical protein
MAQRDLDAALQLLADRAQYITGSTGAAIALRRDGKKDMLCRASTGSNAPELGALLSAEFGLSGESVRTRQVLRCDDIERDERVNREVCRQLGIASVAIMPVVNDDEVLGVFELFSGKVNAFAERDLTALKRLSEMVETAVKLSRAAEQVPEKLLSGSAEAPVAEVEIEATSKELEIENPAIEVEAEFVTDAVLPQEAPIETPAAAQAHPEVSDTANVSPSLSSANRRSEPLSEQPVTAETTGDVLKRPMLWSMVLDPMANAAAPVSNEQDEVPATLRNLRKCEACGFPVSPGRALCVECEEKKWRGHLKTPRAGTVPGGGSGAAAAAAPAPAQKRPDVTTQTSSEAKKAVELPAAAAAASSASRPAAEPASKAPSSEPELVLSAAMEPSQSWVGSHKFVILTLLALGAGAAYLLLR